MNINLYLDNKIVSFLLPKYISGSFSFDDNKDEEYKLINIEARNNRWFLYSTDEVSVLYNNENVKSVEIIPKTFYQVKRNDKIYIIYACDIFNNKFVPYKYNDKLSLTIGKNEDAGIIYNCEFLKGIFARIDFNQSKFILSKNNCPIYINNNLVNSNKNTLKFGDQVTIYSLKIIILKGLILINNSGNNNININSKELTKFDYNISPEDNFEVKDSNLYSKDDYYSKSPRIRRFIKTKEIEFSMPPKLNENQDVPLLLTLGPMFTMGIMSFMTIFNVISNVISNKASLKSQWLSLVMSGTMLISTLFWPIFTRFYSKRMQKRKNKQILEKYDNYLNNKIEEIKQEYKIQKDILLENLIDSLECVNIIEKKGYNFWDKRIDQDDFLFLKIGKGNVPLDIKLDFPKEGFTIEEDELKNRTEEKVKKYKTIEDVPIGYSFFEHKITALMGDSDKAHSFINNIILQLVTFYSYEDVKIVVFTSELKSKNWQYVKYLSHSFNNEKNFRFFSADTECSKNVSEYLLYELNSRLNNKSSTFKPHYVIICDEYELVKKLEFFKEITEIDNNLGFSLIILENKLGKLPSKCNNFITLGIDKQCGILKNEYQDQHQSYFDEEINYDIDMMKVAKKVSNVPIELEEGEKKLPESITFLETENVGKVEQLNVLNRWNKNDSTTSLKAEIGVDEQGSLMFLDLHEKAHGPHGLIAGTTGSGKSEFIITYILSMCINYSPDDVSFIIIDYKGGGLALAFENKVSGLSLPHLAGTITNLDKAEMDRTLVSIDSEIKLRQKMFNKARDTLGESTMDIYKYQKLYKDGKLSEPIPHLFIICDEFAELKTQQPDFMDNLISVARIGRSLGIHLILATQKPSGVVNDQIWSNSRFKICLKVQDEADSKEMLRKNDAAYLKQTGRFYLQVGYDEYYALGQSGWCGAKYYPNDRVIKQVDKSINFINDCGIFIKSLKGSSGNKVEAQGEQLSAILNNIIYSAKEVNKYSKKLWLENIPPIILIDNLFNKYQVNSNDVEAIIGEYDAPEKQEQGLIKYNFLNDGNTIVYGNDGAERELLLNSIIYSTTKKYQAEDINFYAIDYGSESLNNYLNLPQFGGVVVNGEEEEFNNLLKYLNKELKRRKRLFTNYSSEYKYYIKNSHEKLPIITVIFNNYDSIYENYQNLYDDLPDLVRDSERYGIVYIFTCSTINSINSKISSNCHNLYAFKLKDASDYASIFGQRCKIIPRDILGRGLLKNGSVHEFQTAHIVEDDSKLNDFINDFINNQINLNKIKAKPIPILPNNVRIDNIDISNLLLENIPIGISKNELEPIYYNLFNNLGNIISSNKLQNTNIFVNSLINLLKRIVNNNLFIFDPIKNLNLDRNEYQNYFTNNFEQIIDKVIEYIQKLKDANQQLQGVIIIYGINKLINTVNKNKIEDLINVIKAYEKIPLIIVDDSNKIKNYIFEPWFTGLFSKDDGIWIGKGITDQGLFHLSTINKQMTEELKNNMGYIINEGSTTLCKFIDFISKDDYNGK